MSVTAQLADGRTLEFPDGTDPAVVQATVKKMLAPKVDEAQKAKLNEPPSLLEKFAFAFSKSPQGQAFQQIPDVRGVVQGGADAPMGAAQLAANLVGQGDSANKIIKDKEAEYQATRGDSKDFDWARLVGNIIGPANLLMAGPAAATTAGRIAQGGKVGAISAAANPVTGDDFSSEKAAQIGLGAAMGGALPAAWEAAKPVGRVIRNLVDPSLPGGLERAAGRMGNINAGDKRDEIIALLTKAKANVPNSPITAGEASVPANSAEFAAFQEMAKRANPSIYTGDKGLEGAQEAARSAGLGGFAGTKDILANAVEARSQNAAKNYGDAFVQKIKADPTLNNISKNPYFKDALPDAFKEAEARGISPKTDLTEFLHIVKLSLDGDLAKTGDTALKNVQKSSVQEVKTDLVNWLAKKNPNYENARASFAAESKPINEMQVGQYLQDKLQTPLEAGERAAGFAQATKDAPRTIKNAVGNSIYDELGQVLQPKNEAMVNAVLADLQNNAAYKELARSGATAAGKNVGVAMPEAPPTGMFNPKLSVMRALINRVVGKEHGRVLETAGEMMTTPEIMAKAMGNAKPFERQMIVDLLMKQAAATAGQQP